MTIEARLCGCTADTDLAMSAGCDVCGHRDHGKAGCRFPMYASEPFIGTYVQRKEEGRSAAIGCLVLECAVIIALLIYLAVR